MLRDALELELKAIEEEIALLERLRDLVVEQLREMPCLCALQSDVCFCRRLPAKKTN